MSALITAEPNTVVQLPAGIYDFVGELSSSVDNVVLRGTGMDAETGTVLRFGGQTTGAQSILATGDNFVVQDLAIENSPGDAIKVIGTNGVTIRRVRVEWTNGPDENNGAYGLYPVQTRNVLIEDCEVRGASDAGEGERTQTNRDGSNDVHFCASKRRYRRDGVPGARGGAAGVGRGGRRIANRDRSRARLRAPNLKRVRRFGDFAGCACHRVGGVYGAEVDSSRRGRYGNLRGNQNARAVYAPGFSAKLTNPIRAVRANRTSRDSGRPG